MDDELEYPLAFNSDGVILRGWLRRPAGTEPVPVIFGTHGLGSTIDFLRPLASKVVEAGLGFCAFDNRCLGISDGEPRQEIDPTRQVQDIRNAISFVSSRDDVDGERIGMWGASMGGAVAVTVAAIDRRVRAVVGVALVASGWSAFQLMSPPGEEGLLLDRMEQDRAARLQGVAPAIAPVLPDLTDEEASQSTDESVRFLHPRAKTSPTFKPYVTLRSLENLSGFEPWSHAARIGRRAVLLIVASEDKLAPKSDAQRFLDLVPDGGNKQLLEITGGHYVPLDEEFPAMAEATTQFFKDNL